MGFDLYGKAPIVPRENVKKINSIHKQIKLVQSDPDMDTADKHEKVWAYEQTIEALSPGTYFRNNVWWWRPLWMYVTDLCSDILTEKDITSGTFNDGHFISKLKSKKIAKRIREAERSGNLDLYCTSYNLERHDLDENDWRSNYPFSVENALEFATFADHSGGFAIF